MLTLIKNSIANLYGHKLRLVVAFIWIIIGITSVVFVSSVGNAMSELFKHTFSNISPRTSIIHFQPTDEKLGNNQVLLNPFNTSDLSDISAIDGVESVKSSTKPFSLFPGAGSNSHSVNASYFDKGTDLRIIQPGSEKYKLLKGRNIDASDEGRRVIIIDDHSSEDLFKKDNPIGKAITIDNLTYEIVGVTDSNLVFDPVEKTFRKKNIFDSNSSISVVPDRSYKIITGNFYSIGAITHLQLKIKDGFDIKSVSQKAISALEELHPKVLGTYEIQDQSTIQKSTEALTKGIDKFVMIITAVSMLVGGVGIMNIMYVSVMERNKEIGIRRALGAKPNAILFQFLVESVFITACGGVLGIIVGYAVTLYSRNFLPFKPIPSFNSFLYSFFAIVLTGIIFGLIPAYKASKVDPIKIIYK